MRRIPVTLACAAALAAGSAACGTPPPDGQRWLLTPAESTALDSASIDPEMDVTSRGGDDSSVVFIKTDGPIVEFVRPSKDTRSLTPPIEVLVTFSANPAPADPGTLSVRVCKQTFVGCLGSQNVTDRLTAYTTADGINAPHMDVPKGTFRFKFEISDTSGRTTIGSVRVKVE